MPSAPCEAAMTYRKGQDNAARARRGRPHVNFSVPERTLIAIDELVAKDGTNRTEILVAAVDALLEKRRASGAR